MKICSKCGIEKEDTDFYTSQLSHTYAMCKSCFQEYNQSRKDHKKEYDKQYRNVNSEHIKNIKSQYYIDNKESILDDKKQYYIDTKDDKIEYQKQYYIDNKKAILEQKKEYERNRMVKDPVFKLRKRISSAVRDALHRLGKSKTGSILKCLPYTIQELKVHLEKQFEPWMTWNNWGVYDPKTWDDNDSATWTWQIDHIIPQSKLPYTSMEEDNFQKCWALENLRPMSAKQNLLDGINRTRHNENQ